ncbi:MAG: Na+/H+ antiporter [Caldilineaceae bacterium]|nr:Na+/H+ antiporter [Caldilineaceae bacterium]
MIVVLIVASAVAVLTRYVKFPYTVALVLAGLVLALQTDIQIEMTPELVLFIFAPPLLFEAALHLDLRKLRADLIPIATMAVPGVLISAFAIGGVLAFMGVLPFSVGLLFGALISATDPVAVVATFRAVGAPKRLTTIVEGESLFNDGTAVVLFGIVLGLVQHGEFSLAEGLYDFLRESIGGMAVGALLGYTCAQLIARIDDYLIETTLTTIAAYASFALAQYLHFSGVLGVVAAGLVMGSLGPRGMSPTTRIVLFNFWEYLAFLANSVVFILIGLNVDSTSLQRFFMPALFAVFAVLASRAINVYGLGAILRFFKPDLPRSYLHVLYWGGLRGALSLALVLSLPFAVQERTELLAMTFGVVLFTLLIQATTIPTLLRQLGMTQADTTPIEYERLQGKLLASRASRRHLDRLYSEGALIPYAWETVKKELDANEKMLSQATYTMLSERPDLHDKIVSLARVDTLRAQRAALSNLAHEGLLSGDALAQLTAELDEAIQSPDAGSLALYMEEEDTVDEASTI